MDPLLEFYLTTLGRVQHADVAESAAASSNRFANENPPPRSDKKSSRRTVGSLRNSCQTSKGTRDARERRSPPAARQISLIPGWALTIHKARGLTVEDVRIDLGGGAFAAGQLYVALSRARNLDGPALARPLQMDDVRTDPRLDEIAAWLGGTDSLKKESGQTGWGS